ncbi:DUF1631 domain-containing protein [Gilvimarinus agarilyticus]|uniref:DUF1631 domain-containing protein n=1 Tax=Gilvimarinus agarilyticus TaxID=679259 RepID=UPI000697E9FA|nr:DUF1631 domain-containing protein [Gilvimarinus agarilyticus]
MSESSNHENVVSLRAEREVKATQGREPQAVLARMPAAMHALREKARQSLQGLLRNLFDKADDALFELADQATNNHEQNLYFDSMRQVRLHRKDTEADFFYQIDVGFARIMDAQAFPEPNSDDESTNLDNLALVANDELEEMVASETMVNRANEQYSERVQHLTLRMDQLVPVKVYQKNNPVGCDAVCTAFVTASSGIDIDVKARLVLLKLFDRLVMCQLGTLYDELNQHLIEANILPSLRGGAVARKTKSSASKSAERPQQSNTHEGDQGQDENAEELLGTLRELLKAQGGSAAQSQAAPAGPSLSSQDLLSILTLAQQRSAPQASASHTLSADDIKTQVGHLLARGGAGERQINDIDEDVINLVSMMFEFILEDRSLAAPMKAQLARLQIPMIKVAVADKSFFGKGGHPARRLLNEMATAALGWQDTGEENRGKDMLYRQIDQTVAKVLSDFSKDVGIFDSLLLEFRAFQEKEKRRSKILEQRTIDAEDGKAKSQRARADVDAALEEVTAGVALPTAAAELLASAWSNVLFITCLKQGPESETFAKQLQTARELVWSTTAVMTGDNRQRLLKLVPRLLAELRNGLEDIAFNPYQMGQLFKSLEKLHLEILRSKPKAAAPEAAAPPDKPESTPPLSQEPEAVTRAKQPEVPAAPVVAEPSVPDTVAVVETLEPDYGKTAEEKPEPVSPAVASAEVVEPTVADTASTDDIDTQHLALVSNLTQGSWFEMVSASGEAYRCRLAAIIKPTGKYIFVNRTGMKVAEEDRPSLAKALKEGRIRVLDDGMLFDRALESVIGSLRQPRGNSGR